MDKPIIELKHDPFCLEITNRYMNMFPKVEKNRSERRKAEREKKRKNNQN